MNSVRPSYYLAVIAEIIRYLESSGIITADNKFIKPTVREQQLIAEYISSTLIQHGLSTNEALTGKIEAIMKLLFE